MWKYKVSLSQIQAMKGIKRYWQIGDQYDCFGKVMVACLGKPTLGYYLDADAGMFQFYPPYDKFIVEIREKIGEDKYKEIILANDAPGTLEETHGNATLALLQAMQSAGMIEVVR